MLTRKPRRKENAMSTLCNRTALTVCAGLVTAWTAGAPATCRGAPVEVYILSGQSNAVGYNNTDTYTPAPFPESLRSQANVMFWPGSNAKPGMQNVWTTLQVGASAVGEKAFGPEITFGHDMAAAMPGTEIAIIKYAVGGTGIARSKDYTDYIPGFENWSDHGNNFHPPEEGEPTGILYQNLLSNVGSALNGLTDQGKDYRLAGILWMQGEHEAGISSSMANDYQMLLTGLVSSLRQDLSAPNIPVVVGQISDAWIYREAVQTGQENVSDNDPNAAMVVTRDLPRPPNNWAHYDANGMTVLGSRFATAMQTLEVGDPAQGKFLTPLSISASNAFWPASNLDNDATLTPCVLRLLHGTVVRRRGLFTTERRRARSLR